jgi:hypothetical protein
VSYHEPDLFSFTAPASQSDFEQYHERNPQVWAMFRRFTLEAIRAGRTRIGAKMIAERIRWETFIGPAEGDDFKINNNFTAFYARRFMAEHPEHAGIFQTRASRADQEIAA